MPDLPRARLRTEVLKLLTTAVVIPEGTEGEVIRSFHTGGAQLRLTFPVTVELILPPEAFIAEDATPPPTTEDAQADGH